MVPRKKYPSNSRSFFIPEGKALLGAGLEVRRGYFQSIRPSIGRLLLNLDISSAAMYRPGPLIDVCMDFLGSRSADALSRGLNDAGRRRLEHFLKSVKITTAHTGRERTDTIQRVVKSASSITFEHEQYGKLTVAAYFKRQFNITLQRPDIVCVQVWNVLLSHGC